MMRQYSGEYQPHWSTSIDDNNVLWQIMGIHVCQWYCANSNCDKLLCDRCSIYDDKIDVDYGKIAD